jgi:hypothetical protein
MLYTKAISAIFAANKKAVFAGTDRYGPFEYKYKWVGAVTVPDGQIYAFPTNAGALLVINPLKRAWKEIPISVNGELLFTGGCYYNGSVYGFPRRSNLLLRATQTGDLLKVEIIVLDLPSAPSPVDFFYSGALVGSKVYLAPRHADFVGIVNLDDYSAQRIPLPSPNIQGVQYNASAAHPNGKVYFVPWSFARSAGDRVMVLDTNTNEISFMGGDVIASACFGNLSVMPNGIMYGFSSAFGTGMLKIDPDRNEAYNICPVTIEGTEITGSFSQKLMPNGKIYSVCGNSGNLYEFDPVTETCRIAATLDDHPYSAAKCAGSAVALDGSLWCIPAIGRYIYQYIFNNVNQPYPPELCCSPEFSNY